MSTGQGRLGVSDPAVDSLLENLVFLSKRYHSANTKDALVAGLPLPAGILTPELLPRAAERVGLSARRVEKPITEIADLLLPCILLLKDDDACVLLEIDRAGQKAKILQPQAGFGESWFPLDVLSRHYLGSCFFISKKFSFDERSPETLAVRHNHWFWGTLLASKELYRDVFIGSILINLFATVSAIFTMHAYDKIVPNLAFESLWSLAAGAWLVCVFDYVMRIMRSHFVDLAGKQADQSVSATLYAKIMGMRLEGRPASVGAFSKHLQDFEAVRELFTSTTIVTLIDIPFSVLFLVLIWWFGGWLVVIPMVAILLLAGYSLLIQPALKRSIEEGARLAAQKNANLVESVSGIETIKLFGAERHFQHLWEQAVANIASWGIASRKLTNSVSSLASFLQQSTTVAIVVFGVYLIADAALSMGGMIAAVMLTGRAIGPMVQLSVLSTRYNQARQSLQLMDDVMALADEQEPEKKYISVPYLKGSLAFTHVHFTYPGELVPALSDVSFRVQQGEKIGIIGRIGAGKTSLERLLGGLYQSSAGNISVDGIDIGQIHPADLRRNIGCVPQDVILFSGSIKENIILGNPLIDDLHVMRAADIAGVTRFTGSELSGLERQVGEGGRLLSGGQRQAVAIARAMLTGPAILMLDEPTSNMDNRAEHLFKQQLKKLNKETTLLLVTHKTAMLEVVDRLIVMDNGRIISDGPKQEVLNRLREDKVRTSRASA